MKSSPSTEEPPRSPKAHSFWSRHRFSLALALVAALHLLATFYYERPWLIFNEEPNSWLDFDTHIEQVWRVTEALDGWGKSWAYDPHLLAGYPNGTIFDADNKGWELWTFALGKLGVPKGMAFNLFILIAHLLVPWVAFYASRLFGLDRWASLTAMVMALALWYFDSFPHWCWWVGMVAYGFAGYFFLLPLGLLYRFVEDGRARHGVLLAVTMSIAHLIHPYSFVILVFPMVTLYIQRWKSLSPWQHAGLWGAAAAVLATNAYWLIVAFQFWHYILNSAFYCQSTVSFFFTDYLGLLKEPLVTGVLDNRTGFRFAFLALAAVCLYIWRKERDDRFWAFAIGIASMLAIAYFGGYNLVFSQTQPYRHVMPAMFLTIIPAAAFLTRAVREGALRGWPRAAYAVFAAGLVLTTTSWARDALYFLPNFLPDPELTDEDEMANVAVNPDFRRVTGSKGRQMEFRHHKTFEDFTKIADWLNEHDTEDGRVLVEWWILGEHLAWRTDSEILGGFLERNLEHSAANLFRRNEQGDIGHDALKQYFEDYAVKWVLLSRLNLEIEKYEGTLLEPVGFMEPVHRLYRTTVDVSYFAENDGEVEATLNTISVKGTDPQKDVVLRYHWLETFVCEPDCTVEKEPVEHDPVGFIRVRAPHPPDFKIVNGY